MCADEADDSELVNDVQDIQLPLLCTIPAKSVPSV